MEAAIGAVAALVGALLGAGAAMASSRRVLRSALTAIEVELRRERDANVEQGHLRELEFQRQQVDAQVAELFRLQHELRILDYSTREDHWTTAVGDGIRPPAEIRVPEPEPAVAGGLPMALCERLAFLAAHAVRYHAVRCDGGQGDRCWSVLAEMGKEAREAIEVISNGLPAKLALQDSLKAEAYSARNTIASVRDEIITRVASGETDAT